MQMISKRLVYRISAAAGAIAALGLLAAATAPYAVDGLALRQKLVERVGALTGGEVTIKGRVGLVSFLSFSIEAEDVEVKSAQNLGPASHIAASRIEARIAWEDLLFGAAEFERVVIENPAVTLREDAGSADANAALRQIVAALDAGPFQELVLKNGALIRTSGQSSDSSLALTETLPLQLLTARISKSKRGHRLTARGKVKWRGESFGFQARRGRPQTVAGGVKAPFEAVLTSAPVSLAMNGDVTLDGHTSFLGDVAFTAHEPGKLPALLDLGWIMPASVVTFAADGPMRWSRDGVSIDGAVFALNGNEASGSLNVKMPGGCPAIEGTLAFQSLYWQFPSPAARGGVAGQNGWPALIGCLDADLRISAEQIAAGGLRSGSAAAAISAKGSKISATIAELELFTGVLRGHVEIDLSGADPSFMVKTTGHDIDIGRLTDWLHLGGWIEGKAGLHADIRGKGADHAAILKSLTGRAEIALFEGGSLGSSVTQFLETAAAGGVNNRGTALSDVIRTRFNTLKAEFAAANGSIVAKFIDFSEEGARFRTKGNVNFHAQTLDLETNIHTGAVTASALNAVPPAPSTHRFSIEGPWANPKLSFDGRTLKYGAGAAPY